MRIELPMPPSVNGLFLNVHKRGRVKSPEYRAWILQAGLMLRRQGPLPFTERVEVEIDLDEGGRGDCDNRSKAVLDLLVTHGVIPGDSKKWVRRVSIGWVSGVCGCVVKIRTAQESDDATHQKLEKVSAL